MLNIADIAGNLELHDDGIWYSRARSQVSYPTEGNRSCFEIEESSFWFKHRNNCVLEAVRQFPPAGPVLDIGGGNGYVSMGLIRAGIEAIVVEPGPVGALNARHRGVGTVICSTLEDAGFGKATLPAVGMFDVLEHVEDDAGVMDEVREVLRPQGLVYLTVPAYESLYSYEDREAGHYRRYNAAGLSKLLESAGFEMEYLTYIFAILPLPVFLLRTLPDRLGIHRQVTQAGARKDHTCSPGLVGRLMSLVLDTEVRRINRKKTIPFGGSCLAVGRAR